MLGCFFFFCFCETARPTIQLCEIVQQKKRLLKGMNRRRMEFLNGLLWLIKPKLNLITNFHQHHCHQILVRMHFSPSVKWNKPVFFNFILLLLTSLMDIQSFSEPKNVFFYMWLHILVRIITHTIKVKFIRSNRRYNDDEERSLLLLLLLLLFHDTQWFEKKYTYMAYVKLSRAHFQNHCQEIFAYKLHGMTENSFNFNIVEKRKTLTE